MFVSGGNDVFKSSVIKCYLVEGEKVKTCHGEGNILFLREASIYCHIYVYEAGLINMAYIAVFILNQ